MEREFTILVDAREKRGLIFPDHLVMLDASHPMTSRKVTTVRLRTASVTLSYGDYMLQGHEHATVIERKGSLREIAHNCVTSDRTRLLAALGKLRSNCSRPIVMLEGDPSVLARQYAHLHGENLDPGAILDAFIRTISSSGCELLLMPAATIPQRRSFGEWAARLMIAGTLQEFRSCPPTSSPTASTSVSPTG